MGSWKNCLDLVIVDLLISQMVWGKRGIETNNIVIDTVIKIDIKLRGDLILGVWLLGWYSNDVRVSNKSI